MKNTQFEVGDVLGDVLNRDSFPTEKLTILDYFLAKKIRIIILVKR